MYCRGQFPPWPFKDEQNGLGNTVIEDIRSGKILNSRSSMTQSHHIPASDKIQNNDTYNPSKINETVMEIIMKSSFEDFCQEPCIDETVCKVCKKFPVMMPEKFKDVYTQNCGQDSCAADRDDNWCKFCKFVKNTFGLPNAMDLEESSQEEKEDKDEKFAKILEEIGIQKVDEKENEPEINLEEKVDNANKINKEFTNANDVNNNEGPEAELKARSARCWPLGFCKNGYCKITGNKCSSFCC